MIKFRSYLKTNEETISGDIATVTTKLDIVKRDIRKCPLCESDNIINYKDGSSRCGNCDKTINEVTSAESALRSAGVKIKNIRDGKFGTEFDLFKVPDNLDDVLKDFKYDIKQKTLFVFK